MSRQKEIVISDENGTSLKRWCVQTETILATDPNKMHFQNFKACGHTQKRTPISLLEKELFSGKITAKSLSPRLLPALNS